MKKKYLINAAIVLLFVLIAGVLILISRSGSFTAQRALPTLAPTVTPGASPAASTEEKGPLLPQTGAEAYLVVLVRNRVYAIEPLGEERDLTIDQGDGVVNVVHLTPNGFFMHSSTCDNQLCVGQGEVTVENYNRRILGTAVLCLPNQVELELVIPNATPDPDAPDI